MDPILNIPGGLLGAGEASPAYLEFSVSADNETPAEFGTLTLTCTDTGSPSGTLTLDPTAVNEGNPFGVVFTPSEKTFRWKKNGAVIPGATSNPLVISNLNSTDDGTYSCEVTDPVTGEVDEFGDVTVSVVPFAPSDITGLTLLMSTVDPDTVLASIGPDTPAADGQAVRRVNDQSGSGNNFDQATGGLQPTFHTNAYNGKGTLRFNGTSHYMGADGVASVITGNDTPFTVACVCKPDVLGGDRAPWCVGSGSTIYFHWLTFTTSNKVEVWRRYSTDYKAIPASTHTTDLQCLIMVFHGTKVDVWLNGSKIIDGASLNSPDMGANLTKFGIGAASLGGSFYRYFDGDMPFIAVYDDAITDTEVGNLNGYCTSQFGIA